MIAALEEKLKNAIGGSNAKKFKELTLENFVEQLIKIMDDVFEKKIRT